MSYADRGRKRGTIRLFTPRNLKAADVANATDTPLLISFIGDTEFGNPTVYCDSGQRYDWGWLGQLKVHTIIAVRRGVVLMDALPQILSRTDTLGIGYPVLVDVDAKEVACVVDKVGGGVQTWQVIRGTDLWQQYFTE